MSKTPNTRSSAVYITRRQAALRYSISVRKLDYLIEDGVIPVIRLSKRCLRIPVAKADEALAKLQTGGGKIMPEIDPNDPRVKELLRIKADAFRLMPSNPALYIYMLWLASNQHMFRKRLEGLIEAITKESFEQFRGKASRATMGACLVHKKAAPC